MSKFEMILVSGFVLNFWEKIQVPVLLLVGISGFVVYRYRETRALTLAQFLEMRYSRRFRLFMGGLAFVSGHPQLRHLPRHQRPVLHLLPRPARTTCSSARFAVSTFALIMFTLPRRSPCSW